MPAAKLDFKTAQTITERAEDPNMAPHEKLGFDHIPSEQEIKQRYKSIVYSFHPDKANSNQYKKYLALVNNAMDDIRHNPGQYILQAQMIQNQRYAKLLRLLPVISQLDPKLLNDASLEAFVRTSKLPLDAQIEILQHVVGTDAVKGHKLERLFDKIELMTQNRTDKGEQNPEIQISIKEPYKLK